MFNGIFSKYPKAKTRFSANIAAVKSVTLQDIWKLFDDLTLHCNKYRKKAKKKERINIKQNKSIHSYREEETQEKGISLEIM